MKSVLVFDSGVGGLSVYREIAMILPMQHIIYAFDNEAFPYGELDDDVLIYRVCNMVSAICRDYDVALVVIACNTASTLVLTPLRQRISIPVVGVVPAIKPAALLSKTKQIGLLATPATVRRDYIYRLIDEFASNCGVKMVSSIELVEMGEAKLRGFPVNKSRLRCLLRPLINQVDCVVLGCTHFPLLKTEIEEILGEQCLVIDSGKAIAERVSLLLSELGLKATAKNWLQHEVLSSAPVKKEKALNKELFLIGLSAIKRAPHF